MIASVVLPMYRAEAFVADRLRFLLPHLDAAWPAGQFEVIVVDDGSNDASVEAAQSVPHPALRVLRLPQNRGKSAAVREGVLAARGDAIVMTDIDVPYDPILIPALARMVSAQGFDLAIGDRSLAAGGRRASAHDGLRHALSEAFAAFVRIFVIAGIGDTQCGIKAFRRPVAVALFSAMKEERFAGDVELLYLALKANLAIRRVPVVARYHGTSTVRVWRTGLAILSACFRIRARFHRGETRTPAIESVARSSWPPEVLRALEGADSRPLE